MGTRGELLPTRQDVLGMEGTSDDASAEDAMKLAAVASKRVHAETEMSCLELLSSAATDGRWGVEIVSVKIDSIDLADEKIIADLQSIAHSRLATKRRQMEGQAELIAAEVAR